MPALSILFRLFVTLLVIVSLLLLILINFSDSSLKRKQSTLITVAEQELRSYTYKNLTYPTGQRFDDAISAAPGKRANAAFIVLARNSDLMQLKKTIRDVEARFNSRYLYPYVILNQEAFDQDFKEQISNLTKARVKFGIIPSNNWSIPAWIDQNKLSIAMNNLRALLHGNDINWRHMCRFYAGLFMDHPLMTGYDYFWRLEAGVSYTCQLDYDPFVWMQENGKIFGFTITLRELPLALTGFWESVTNFFENNPELSAKSNSRLLITSDGNKTYNGCHFWSNMEIGDLRFFRSEGYRRYFKFLDKLGGIYYARWGDAPIHTVALTTMLNISQIHYFEDIGYDHTGSMHCPQFSKPGVCSCDPGNAVDYRAASCLNSWENIIY